MIKTTKITGLFLGLMLVFTSFAFATTLVSKNNIPAVQVGIKTSAGSFSGWKQSTDVHTGETLVFELHAFANGGNVEGLKAKLDNINGHTFDNQSKNISGFVRATNASKRSNSTKVNFKGKGKLTLVKYKWVVKLCNGSESKKSLPSGQEARHTLTSNGVYLGNLPANYNSNLILYFDYKKVDDATPAPNSSHRACYVNGVKVSDGSSRAFYSTTHTTNSCSNVKQVRKCNDGTISGNSTYKYTSCRVDSRTHNTESEVFSKTATNVSTTCATLNGRIEMNDDNKENVYFQYGANNDVVTVDVREMTTDGSFSKRVCGLTPDTTYIFAAVSDHNEGRIFTFKTNPETTPVENGSVDTNSATNVEKYSARLNGDVEDEDMNDVWFAFSRTDNTPNCSSNSQKVNARGGSDEGDDFYANVNSLRKNTRYYFRACGEDKNGNEVEGNVRSFRTDKDSSIEEAKVYTNSATNIQKYSAQLNGYIDINDTKNGKVYFVYGTSSSYMNKKTSELRVNNNTPFQAITGLRANTKYYFQAIIKDNNGTVDRGIVRSFRTLSSNRVAVNGQCSSWRVNKCVKGYFVNIKDTATKIKWSCRGINSGKTALCTLPKYYKKTVKSKPVVVSKPIEVVVNETNITTTNYSEKGLEINKWVGKSKTGTFGVETTAKVGDTIFYKIKVRNTSDKVVAVKIEDFLPEELNDKDGTTADSNRYMTWVENLQPGQTKTYVKELVVGENVAVGEVIDSIAKITVDDITEDTNNVAIEIVDGKIVAKNSNSASIFGANSSFFPSSIFGWLLTLLLAFAVLFLGTRVLTTISNKG